VKCDKTLQNLCDQLTRLFQAARWQVLTALDITTELGLLLLPIHLVWKLQMPWTKKAVLLVAFYLRLPVIALSIGRNAYTLRLSQQTSDPGLDSAIVTIWLEVQLAYALAASTLSALKHFTESFNSGFGLGFTRGNSENGSYALSHMSRSGTGTSTSIVSRSKSDTHDAGTTSPQAEMHKHKHNRFSSFTNISPFKLRPDVIGSRSSATATATTTSEDSHWNYGSDDGVVHPGKRVRESDLAGHRGPGRASEGLVIMRETELTVRRDPAPGYMHCQKQ
jgi:hypothetical protein